MNNSLTNQSTETDSSNMREVCNDAYNQWKKDPQNKHWKDLPRPAFHGGYDAGWQAALSSKIPTIKTDNTQVIINLQNRVKELESELSSPLQCQKCDDEMLRVKACEHIAEGDMDGNDWRNLRNICPSTIAVAKLRDDYEALASLPRMTEEELANFLVDNSVLFTREAPKLARALIAKLPHIVTLPRMEVNNAEQ